MISTDTMCSFFRVALLLLVAALISGTQVYAQGGPPTFAKEFQPSTIGPGSSSTLVFTINNTDPTPATDLAFTDMLPAGVTVADGSNPTTTCDGTLTAPEGSDTITLSGGQVGASTTCTISVNVTSSTGGTHTNTSGDLTSSAGNSGSATADLTVSLARIGFFKSFVPDTIAAGTRSTLTFTLSNGGSNAFNISFTDNLPGNVTFADPANLTTDCIGNLTTDEDAGVISFLSGFLATESSCTISLEVVGIEAGRYYNESTNLSSSQGDSGKATATLTVTQTPLSIVKEFTDDPAAPGGNAALQFTIRNANRGATATDITFSDDLEATLTGLMASGLPMNDVCGSGSTLSGTSTITLTGGTLNEGETCIIDVTLDIPAGAATGIYPDTTTAVMATVGGLTQTGNRGSDNLHVAPVPTITKSFLNLAEEDIEATSAGNTVLLEFTITNNSPDNSLNSIFFFDELAVFLGGVTPNGLPMSDVCGAGSSLTFSSDLPNTGSNSLFLNNGSLAAGGDCTFQVELNIPESAANGTYTNTTSPVTGTVDGEAVEGTGASDTLDIVSAPTLSKDFTDDPVGPGDMVTLEFTLALNENAPGDATDISFTDDLDATLSGLVAVGLPQNDVCGTGSTLSGTTTISFDGGTLSPNEMCTFSVTLQVPVGAASGSFPNTTSDVMAMVSGFEITNIPATADLNIVTFSIDKEFTDDPAAPGDPVTLEFTLTNDDPVATVTDISFTDDLDATLSGLVATGLPQTNVCNGTGDLTTPDGGMTLIFSGGTLTPSTSCTFSVTLQVPVGAAFGEYPNTTSNVSATVGGNPGTFPPATDDLLIIDPLEIAITKEFTDDPVAPGDPVTLEFTIDFEGVATDATDITFTDDLDATLSGLMATSTPQSNVCGAGSEISGTSTLTLTGGTLAPGTSCTFSVTLQVPGGASNGTYPNTTSDVTADVDGTPISGDPATDNLSVSGIPDVSATKVDAVADAGGDGTLNPGDTIEYTVGIANNGGRPASSVMFNDMPDANTTLVFGSVTTTQGTVTTGNTDGDMSVSVDVGDIGNGGTVTITFQVLINSPFSADAEQVCNQGTVSGGNFDNELTGDPDATGAGDPEDETCTPVIADPDVSATKTDALLIDNDSDTQADPGDTIRYTIVVTNDGDQDASGAMFDDTPDANTSLVVGSVTTTQGTVTTGNTAGDGEVAVDIGTVSGDGGTVTITFDVVVDDPIASGVETVSNQGTVSGDNFDNELTDDPDDETTDDSDPTVTPIDASPDLSVTKDDGADTVVPGDMVSYTIDYANNGNQNATGVTITDTVPEGTTFDAANSTAGWVCTPDGSAGSTCTFDVGALDGGTGDSVTFAVTVNNPIAAGIEEITNTASITDDEANGTDPNPDDNTDTDTNTVDAAPDLAITKDDGDLTAQPGDTVPYSLTFANNGNQGATGVVITDTVPEGTTFDAANSTAGWVCTPDGSVGSTCTFTVAGEVDGGGSTDMVTFAVTVDNPAPAGLEEITNTASITDDEANGADPNPDDNTDTDTTPLEATSNVSATKTDALLVDENGNGQTDPGETLVYTIIVTNDGNQTVADVTVNDTVDPLLDLDCGSLTPGQGTVVSCTPGPGGSFTVDLTAINGEPNLLTPRASTQLTFSATVVMPFPATADEVANQAVISYTGETGTEEVLSDDPDTARPRDPTVTPINLEADLELTKTASTTTPNFGTEVTFTLTVTNQGPVNVVRNVEVRDVLPKGLDFVSAEGDGDYNPETGIWDLNGVALGAPETIEITVLVDVLTPITNIAEVLRADLPDPDSAPGDGQGDDSDSVTLTPIAADLELSKRLTSRVESADGTTVTGTFALTLTNEGPSPATGVEVMEFFAGEMTFVSADPADAFNPATNTWTVGTLAVGASTTLSITVTAPTGGTVINLAEVSAVNETDPDSEPLDGTGDDFDGAALNRGENVPLPPLAADLSITKMVSQSQPILGEQITYTIEVSNAGPFTTAGVTVTDLLPEGLAFVSASASSDDEGCDPCSYDAETGIWDIGVLTDGETATLMIVVEVTAEGEITNIAKISQHHLPDPDSDVSIDNPDEDDVATAIALVASGKATSVVRSGGEGIPETFEIGQNYPNPFNPQTTIPFGVPQSGHVVVEVYNLLGQRVAVLMDQELAAGRHEVVWQALDQPTGMYLVRLVAGKTTLTKRVTLVK